MSWPTIVPPRVVGEAVASYTQRLAALNGWRAGAAAVAVFGGHWRFPSWTLPCAIQAFARGLNADLGLAPVDWLLCHTLAPYFAATLPAARRQALFTRLLGTPLGPRQPFLPLGLDQWFARTAVLCAACDEDNRKQHGFSLVQRHWLLPFVTRCEIHGELLRDHPEWLPFNPGRGSRRVVLAQRHHHGAAWTLRGLSVLHGGSCEAPELMALLAERGFRTDRGQLRRGELASTLAQYLRARIEHPEMQGLLADVGQLQHLLGPLGSVRRHLHPVVALQLRAALQDEAGLSHPVPFAHRPTITHQERAAALGDAFARATTATQAAQTAGVSVTTAVVHALAAGKPVTLRPKRLKPAVRAAIVQALEEGASIAETARRTEVSSVSVYRVLRSRPQLVAARQAVRRQMQLQRRQQLWQKLVKDHPGLSRTQLRALAPSHYAFLYRHARAWLQSQRTAPAVRRRADRRKSRVPAGADRALAAGIAAAAKLDPMRLPPRNTPTGLLKRAGRPNAKWRDRALPQAAVALASSAESLEQFVYRRISAAAADLKNEGWPVQPLPVARASRLRPATIYRSGVSPRRVIDDTRASAWERLGHE